MTPEEHAFRRETIQKTCREAAEKLGCTPEELMNMHISEVDEKVGIMDKLRWLASRSASIYFFFYPPNDYVLAVRDVVRRDPGFRTRRKYGGA